MNHRIKNIRILVILTLFLLMIEFIPVTCLFKQVTGISCPSCGMTRAFHCILNLDIIGAFHYNILSIPLFAFISISIIIMTYEIIANRFEYIPKLLNILSNKIVLIIILLFFFISFIINNISII